jgi:predicted lipoprotein with Yx(FWY)xxD motif
MKSNSHVFVNKPIWWLSALVPLMLALSACAAAATPAPTPTSAPAPTMAPTMAAPSEATINVATDPTLGKILVDGKGMTLYMYTKDEPDKSNCSGGCAKVWPPLLTMGNPTLGPGVDASLVGSATLADGTKIVTYNKMPLYYYAKDTKAGDTTGQDVGSVWYVVGPDGKPIGYTMPSSATSAPAATTAPAATSAPAAAAASEATINVATDPTLGKILVDGKGMTLYIFTKDGPNQSNCNAGCLKAWPPLLTMGNPTLGPGVDASMVGSATLADGTKIVTYNSMPLYYYAKDTKAGDTTGQGVGSVWYVIGPDGKPVE